MLSNHLVEDDRAHLIHPVTSLRAHEQRGVTILQSAKGCFVTDASGHTLLDGFAGLWCVNAGYGHESIIEVAMEQMRRLPYATGYFHFGSEPAIRLAAKLAEITPGDLNRVFFTLGGSDAVDTVVRMVRYYNNVRGMTLKKQFISLERGYHGSSSNGAGLTALPVFHEKFDLPRSWQHYIPSPYPYRNAAGEDPAAIIAASVQALKNKVREIGQDNVAAFICEPVQGSGGVIVPPTGYLTAMQAACRELGILFIIDEVITGFGRTGPMFACEHEGIEPDFMTIAKGLTSGYVPMGAAIVSNRVYEVIADGTVDGSAFGHGLTYSGHPVSAAVGLEVMRLYQEGGLIENGQRVGAYFGRRLAELRDHPLVGDVRSIGLLGAIELVADKETKRKPAKEARVGARLFDAGYKNGLIFRAFGDDTIGFAPPLCITESEVDLLIERLDKTLALALDFKDL
ncbi:aminotransferase class III-fold pyridoxal phosphate-dependent enzyme [Mesorhizobium tamadayense]|uniref:Aminotransferase class III-fold pyridoxal phosphate-dependent enzyme n=1 Tax=Mesorhizobium tamadayense TaxID=425306 RepID=A0A3P3EPX5_9HYPH|nr:aminotransferase class III-fold pyridoxal phosphate-dependent enzyme [Mesorhizobium tamadayense]RRH88281.1 aminotransferase class III-fold pyridoxal phosphate-dependent enzyme [Mesorhizobium tamadayense]